MRKILVCALVALGITAGGASVPASAGSTEDVRARVSAIPGMRFLKETTEKVPAGFRHLLFAYRQPIDHRRPKDGTFEQRFVLLHKAFDRPVVFETVGYGLYEAPYRLEVTRLVDGNQLMPEHRFFPKSRPERVDWSKLDIWQAATDHHRLITALRGVYTGKWLTIGGSKGGMTAVYHRRFYPGDVDGTLPHVAPNDVDNGEDSAHLRFFEQVGTPQCRDRIRAFQREVLARRDELLPPLRKDADAAGHTYQRLGGLDRVYEVTIRYLEWTLWAGGSAESDCAGGKIPARGATTEQLHGYLRDLDVMAWCADRSEEMLLPYSYQAATQLGWASLPSAHLKGLLKYPYRGEPDHVPADIPVRFQPGVMKDIDTWVRAKGSRLLFVYGAKDPWSQEKFELGSGSRESGVFVARDAAHQAKIAALTPAEQQRITALLRKWTGLPATRSAGERTDVIPGFDRAVPVPDRPFPR